MFSKMLINLKEHNGLFVSVPIHYGNMSFFTSCILYLPKCKTVFPNSAEKPYSCTQS